MITRLQQHERSHPPTPPPPPEIDPTNSSHLDQSSNHNPIVNPLITIHKLESTDNKLESIPNPPPRRIRASDGTLPSGNRLLKFTTPYSSSDSFNPPPVSSPRPTCSHPIPEQSRAPLTETEALDSAKIDSAKIGIPIPKGTTHLASLRKMSEEEGDLSVQNSRLARLVVLRTSDSIRRASIDLESKSPTRTTFRFVASTNLEKVSSSRLGRAEFTFESHVLESREVLENEKQDSTLSTHDAILEELEIRMNASRSVLTISTNSTRGTLGSRNLGESTVESGLKKSESRREVKEGSLKNGGTAAGGGRGKFDQSHKRGFDKMDSISTHYTLSRSLSSRSLGNSASTTTESDPPPPTTTRSIKRAKTTLGVDDRVQPTESTSSEKSELRKEATRERKWGIHVTRPQSKSSRSRNTLGSTTTTITSRTNPRVIPTPLPVAASPSRKLDNQNLVSDFLASSSREGPRYPFQFVPTFKLPTITGHTSASSSKSDWTNSKLRVHAGVPSAGNLLRSPSLLTSPFAPTSSSTLRPPTTLSSKTFGIDRKPLSDYLQGKDKDKGGKVPLGLLPRSISRTTKFVPFHFMTTSSTSSSSSKCVQASNSESERIPTLPRFCEGTSTSTSKITSASPWNSHRPQALIPASPSRKAQQDEGKTQIQRPFAALRLPTAPSFTFTSSRSGPGGAKCVSPYGLSAEEDSRSTVGVTTQASILPPSFRPRPVSKIDLKISAPYLPSNPTSSLPPSLLPHSQPKSKAMVNPKPSSSSKKTTSSTSQKVRKYSRVQTHEPSDIHGKRGKLIKIKKCL